MGVPYGPESNYALGYRGITWGDLLSQKNSVVLPRDKNTKLVSAANYEFVGTYKVFGAEIPSIRSLFWPTSYTMVYGWKVYSVSCSGKN